MHHDAIIIGGSFAGLSAATYIARGRRSACVIDAGAPRNRFAAHSHGFLTHDGSAPGAMLAAARAQVAAYPTVRMVEGRAHAATRTEDGFAVTLATGETLESARLVLAFGIADDLPEIPGLAERWGRTVLHCPYCHGFEFGGQRLGVLNVSPHSAQQAMLIAEWGPTTFFLNGGAQPDDTVLAELEKRGVAIEPAQVTGLSGDGTELAAVELAGGRSRDLDALYIGTRTRFNSEIAAQLGCALDDAPNGPVIRADAMKMTTVPGVFAAGDITRSMHSATFASADGVMAGVALHRSLVF
jgi:thioredoxin reductase